MEKPSKCWQFGLDFIKDRKGNIYLIEINNAAAPVYYKVGLDNYKWQINHYCSYLVKYLKSIGLTEVNFKYLFGDDKKERFRKTLGKDGIKMSYSGIPLYCERDSITKEKTDWWTVDKKVIKNYNEELKKIGITPIGKMGKYDKNSCFPNFLIKPYDGLQGNGIVFYKQEESVTKKGFITEEYIQQKPVTESYNFINGKWVKKIHPPRLCDYRVRIIIDDLGNVSYLGTYRRTSSVDIPTELPNGEINSRHPNYHVYLCNLSQEANRTLVLEKEEVLWEEISVKLGKMLYKNFLKK